QAVVISVLLTLGIMIAFVHGITGWSFSSHLGWKRRSIYLLLTIFLIIPNWRTNLLGLILLGAAFIFDMWWSRREKRNY
ncbi:MAG: hypothetical protein V2B13_16810, partial [Pseudomonadota bacterium]